jgi:predicted 2-oxoglutarate/Fe(II)-dependent dioxygenase YbiX
VGYSVTELGSEIFLIEHLIEPEVCQQIIQASEACHFEAASILIKTVDRDVRSSGLLGLNPNQDLQHKELNDLLLQRLSIVQQALYQIYGIQFPYAEPCSILRYLPGQNYQRHVDNILLSSRFQELEQGIPTRDVSVVGYLNGDCEGGETWFDRQQVKVKPQTGSAIVFPAYYTHPHQALPVKQGKKYAWTTWLYR